MSALSLGLWSYRWDNIEKSTYKDIFILHQHGLYLLTRTLSMIAIGETIKEIIKDT